jgi:hypothetical protein
MNTLYHGGSRTLQDRIDARWLSNRIVPLSDPARGK